MKEIQLKTENIIKKIGEGKESTIYLYKQDDKEVALKLFKCQINLRKSTGLIKIDVTKEDLERKREKLKLLDRDPCMLDEVKLYDLVFDHGSFVGYTMEVLDLPSINDYMRAPKRTKIQLLKALKRKIEDINNNGVYIGDFASYDNFLVTKDHDIKLIDVDNFSVHGLDFDLPTGYTDDYLFHDRDMKNVDNYSFNFFTIAFYKGCYLATTAAYLREHNLPYRFNTEENRELLDDLYSNRNYKKRYFLDNRKKGLFK